MNKNLLNSGIAIIFLSPVLAVWAAIQNFSLREARFVLILFIGIFGMTMIFDKGTDGSRHVELLKTSYADKSFADFFNETKNIILLQPGLNEGRTNDDLYLHVVSYLVAPISTNSTMLYFVVGLIYGFFFITGVSKVFFLVENRWNSVLILLFICFVSWKSLEGINSIRNWTAAWVFFNGAFSYYQTKNRKYILLVILAPLIHFAYIFITIPFYVVLFFGNRPKVYTAILVITFIFSFQDINLIKDVLSFSELGEVKAKAYIREGTSEDFLLEKGAQSFHANYYLVAGKIFITVLFYYAISTLGYLFSRKHSYLMLSLASTAILLTALSNLATFSYSVKTRVFVNSGFYSLAYLLILYAYNYKFKEKPKRIFGFDALTAVSTPLAFLFIFTQLSHIGEFTDIRIFFSPVVYPFLGEQVYSLKEVLQNLIS